MRFLKSFKDKNLRQLTNWKCLNALDSVYDPFEVGMSHKYEQCQSEIRYKIRDFIPGELKL